MTELMKAVQYRAVGGPSLRGAGVLFGLDAGVRGRD
jgi:hypothetical protein